MKLFLLTLVVVATAKAIPELDSKFLSKLSPKLKQALRSKQEAETFNVFVDFNSSTSSVLQQVAATSFPDRAAKITAMRQMLIDLAASSQAEAIQMMAARGLQTTSFWISNQLFVKSANFDAILELASKNEVDYIEEEQIEALEEPPVSSSRSATPAVVDYEWGIKKIQAPEAWAALGNNDGRGVVVANIDTGVRLTHEALVDNFFGDYGWFDPPGGEPLPTDEVGHGTHAIGIIVGKAPIGVAPGAKWMSCRGCATLSCNRSHLYLCGQFFVCPTLADGSAPDCSKAPHIVANTWGDARGSTWFNPVVDVWAEAGIIPVFSNGNTGPECATATSPGDSPKVIAAGSTTMSDAITSFSSAGPALDGSMKPDISAPGSGILSAHNSADDAYASLSGSPQACSHVAGAIALLLTRNRNVPLEKIRELLVDNAERNLSFSGRVCDGIPDSQFPNHVFGGGRLNILRSVMAQTNHCSKLPKLKKKRVVS